MIKFINRLFLGDKKRFYHTAFSALLEGIVKIIPSVIVMEVVLTLYHSYRNQTNIPFDYLYILAGILVVWFGLQWLTSGIAYDQSFGAAYESSAKGRIKLAQHIKELPMGYLESKDPADMTTMMLSDYTSIEQTVSHLVPAFVSSFGLPVIGFFSLMFIDWRLAVALFAMIPISLLIIGLTSKFQIKLSKNHIKSKVEAANRLQEYLAGIKEIKAHGLSGDKFSRLSDSFDELRKDSIRIEGLMGPIIMAAIGLMRTGFMSMIFIGTYLLFNGQLTVEIFIIFLLIGVRLYEPLTAVLINFAEMRYANVAAKRIETLLNEETMRGEDYKFDHLDIEFKNVTFSYYHDIQVLKHVNLKIKPQTLTALVGPSGSGKTTIAKLISRFYDVQGGSILLGGKDIKDISTEALLKQVSYVFQDVYLFNDTIINNIRVGNQNATDEEVYEAAKKAKCHTFIQSFDDGYETLVGEGGSTLSGGQKQRISIARALLKDAPIVLLDEATASLDPENEVLVQDAINHLVKDKTVIMIAHRLKTVMKAHQIVVLENGEIKELGTHNQLVKQKGLYKKLWQIQQKSEGWHI